MSTELELTWQSLQEDATRIISRTFQFLLLIGQIWGIWFPTGQGQHKYFLLRGGDILCHNLTKRNFKAPQEQS